MESIYKYPHLNVRPFLIVPNPSINQEQYMVMEHSHTHENRNELISKTIDLTSNFACPLIVIATWHRGHIIIAQSFLSDLECSRSGRKGLRIIYGAEINPMIFFELEKVCEKTFNFFNVFLSNEFNANAESDNYDPILTRFQNLKNEEDNFKTSAFDHFLRTLENAFFLEKNRMNNFSLRSLHISITLLKLRSLKIRQPCLNFNDAQRFWLTLDNNFKIK